MLLTLAVLMQLISPCLSAKADTVGFVFGDVNADGKVTLKDASVIQLYAADLAVLSSREIYLGDIDGDGDAQLKDAYMVQQYVVSFDKKAEKNVNGYAIGDILPSDFAFDNETVPDTDDGPTDTEEILDTEPDRFSDTDPVTDSEEVTDTELWTDSEEVTDTEPETDSEVTTDEEDSDEVISVDLISEEEIADQLNGSFERGDTHAENWENIAGNPNAKIASGSGVNGSKAIMISNKTEYTDFTLNRMYGLDPKSDYKLTAKIKCDNVATSKKTLNGAWIDVGFCCHYVIADFEDTTSSTGRGSNIYSENNWKTGTSDWIEATVYFVPDIFGKADIVCALAGTGTAYFDDLKIERIDDFNTAQNGAVRYRSGQIGLVMHKEDVEQYDQSLVQQWADEIGEGYMQIADFVGTKPHHGDVLYIISSEEPALSGVQAYGAITPIKWLRGYAANNCKNRCEKGVRSMVPFHEMGHNFDSAFPWTFYTESSADFMATYISYLHPDDVFDFRGWGFQFYKFDDFINYIKSEDSNCYDTIIVNKSGDYYVTALNYVLWRSCSAVGIDVTRENFHRMLKDYDPKYKSCRGKFMYLMMRLQETYNDIHPEATGREIIDSFPEGEFDYVKNVIHSLYSYSYSEDQEIYSVSFKDLDGSDLWFDFVPRGGSAQAPEVAPSPVYGKFIGWSSELDNVTSDMTVTPIYENSPNVSLTVKNADNGTAEIACGEFAEVSLDAGNSGAAAYRVTCTCGSESIFDSGYTSNVNYKFMVKKSGACSINVYIKTSDGAEMLARSASLNVQRAVTVYYSGFSSPYIHYCIESGAWTAVPGVAMQPTQSVSGYTHKYVIPLETGKNKVKACFNDGGSNWDNNNSNDYSLSEGVYGIKNGSTSDLSK